MAVSTYKGLDLPPGIKSPTDAMATLPSFVGFLRQVWVVVNNMLLGKINAVVEITLTANSATTALTDPRLSAGSHLTFMPLTANALADHPNLIVTAQGKQTATVTHTNNAQTDRTYRLLIIG